MYSLPTEHKIILTTFLLLGSLQHMFFLTSYDIYQDVQSFPRERLTLNINSSRKQRDFTTQHFPLT